MFTRKIPLGSAERPQLTVMHSSPPPDGTTKYIDQIVTEAPTELRFTYFSWKAVFTEKFDVFHVHWPEVLLRSDGGLGRAAKALTLVAMLTKFRLTRVPIIQTLHNLKPHESGNRLERVLLGLLNNSTALFVRINPVTPLVGDRTVTVLHGHYRGRFSQYDQPEAVEGNLLHFGLIRPYKGVERLVEVFEMMGDRQLNLRIVGDPSGGLRETIELSVARDKRMSALLKFVADDVLVAEVCKAELVILPYTEMHNSGALLVTLSLNRPVLVPRTDTSEAIAKEVGPGWVFIFDGTLAASDISAALEVIRSSDRSVLPHLEGRDWENVGEGYYDAYVQATRRVQRFR